MEKSGGASPSPTVNVEPHTNGLIKTTHSGSSLGTFLSRKVRKNDTKSYLIRCASLSFSFDTSGAKEKETKRKRRGEFRRLRSAPRATRP